MLMYPQSGRPRLLYHYGVNAGYRCVLTFLADGSFGLALTIRAEANAPCFLQEGIRDQRIRIVLSID